MTEEQRDRPRGSSRQLEALREKTKIKQAQQAHHARVLADCKAAIIPIRDDLKKRLTDPPRLDDPVRYLYLLCELALGSTTPNQMRQTLRDIAAYLDKNAADPRQDEGHPARLPDDICTLIERSLS